MRFAIRSLLLVWAILALGSRISRADDNKPATAILGVTDYRGLAGPLTEFTLKDDGTWTYMVQKGGKNIDTQTGKFTAAESRAFMKFIEDLELEKHTRKRNVEDAPMLSVLVGKKQFLDISPEQASKIMTKVKESTTPVKKE